MTAPAVIPGTEPDIIPDPCYCEICVRTRTEVCSDLPLRDTELYTLAGILQEPQAPGFLLMAELAWWQCWDRMEPVDWVLALVLGACGSVIAFDLAGMFLAWVQRGGWNQ